MQKQEIVLNEKKHVNILNSLYLYLYLHFNSEIIIENIGILCGEKDFFELPYWETINNYLKLFSSEELQNVACQLVKGLIRSRAFDKKNTKGWRKNKRDFSMSAYLHMCRQSVCLPICFSDCKKKKWKYIIRLKKGRIPSVYEEYKTISKLENNLINDSKGQYSYAADIDYRENKIIIGIDNSPKSDYNRFI